MRFQNWAVCLMLSLLSLSGSAQEVVKGQVIDGETGDPVFAAGVLVQGTTTGTSTDFDGRFRIEVPTLPVHTSVPLGWCMQTFLGGFDEADGREGAGYGIKPLFDAHPNHASKCTPRSTAIGNSFLRSPLLVSGHLLLYPSKTDLGPVCAPRAI